MISSANKQVGEDRTGDETELALAVRRFLDDLRAGDVAGHQVRGELDALELRFEDFRETAHKEGLGEAGHADHQDVSLHGEGDEQIADDLILADDALAEFGGELLVTRRDAAQQFHVGLGRPHG